MRHRCADFRKRLKKLSKHPDFEIEEGRHIKVKHIPSGSLYIAHKGETALHEVRRFAKRNGYPNF